MNLEKQFSHVNYVCLFYLGRACRRRGWKGAPFPTRLSRRRACTSTSRSATWSSASLPSAGGTLGTSRTGRASLPTSSRCRQCLSGTYIPEIEAQQASFAMYILRLVTRHFLSASLVSPIYYFYVSLFEPFRGTIRWNTKSRSETRWIIVWEKSRIMWVLKG